MCYWRVIRDFFIEKDTLYCYVAKGSHDAVHSYGDTSQLHLRLILSMNSVTW